MATSSAIGCATCFAPPEPVEPERCAGGDMWQPDLSRPVRHVAAIPPRVEAKPISFSTDNSDNSAPSRVPFGASDQRAVFETTTRSVPTDETVLISCAIEVTHYSDPSAIFTTAPRLRVEGTVQGIPVDDQSFSLGTSSSTIVSAGPSHFHKGDRLELRLIDEEVLHSYLISHFHPVLGDTLPQVFEDGRARVECRGLSAAAAASAVAEQHKILDDQLARARAYASTFDSPISTEPNNAFKQALSRLAFLEGPSAAELSRYNSQLGQIIETQWREYLSTLAQARASAPAPNTWVKVSPQWEARVPGLLCRQAAYDPKGSHCEIEMELRKLAKTPTDPMTHCLWAQELPGLTPMEVFGPDGSRWSATAFDVYRNDLPINPALMDQIPVGEAVSLSVMVSGVLVSPNDDEHDFRFPLLRAGQLFFRIY
jgi:hypothetical protein